MREKRIIKEIMAIFLMVALVLIGLGTYFLVKDIKNNANCYKVKVRITQKEQVGEDRYLVLCGLYRKRRDIQPYCI